jgi:hypothetical protein
MKSNSRLRPVAILVLGNLLAAGCQDTGPNNESYFVQDETRSVNAALDRQMANGARHDAMLRDQHFDGARLNALGRTKLDRMMAYPGPLAVYLPGSFDDPSFQSRRESIVAYAKDRGRGGADVTIARGVNPGASHLATAGISRMSKTELGSIEQGAAQNESSTANDPGLPGNNLAGPSGLTGVKTGGPV